MPDHIDQHYLEYEQYKDASHLNSRIQLHLRFSTNPYGWFKWVYDQLGLQPCSSVLEIGCGSGFLWVENKDRIPARCSITLSDFSPGMIREARGNLGLNHTLFAYEASNAMAVPFPQRTFDTVIANHMLYHLPDIPRALGEIARVLKPGGRFFAATNGESHLSELSEIMDSQIHFSEKSYSPTFSAHQFTLENGTEQLSPWFHQIEIRHYVDSLIVTEADPLLSYIFSMIPKSDMTADDSRLAGLSQFVNRKIDQDGPIHIQKSIGIFVCSK